MQQEVAQQRETRSDDGIDVTLIRWMWSLTPAERLQVLQRNAVSILRLRANRTESPVTTFPTLYSASS
jgi:hypothetical protein